MPFQRPTPLQIRDRLAAEFDALFPGADPRRRRSVEGVLVRALAIVSHELHGHLEWAGRQMHIATADLEELEIRAAVWGITRNPAVAAVGKVTFTGTAGRTIPADAELQRRDGARFRTVADCTIGGGGTGTIGFVAVTAGAAGSSPAGTALALLEPVEGVQSRAAVAVGGDAVGFDVEDLESLRARTMQRIQEPPAGGAAHDYRAWVKDVVGETLVWVKPYTPMPGYVTVFFIMPDGTIPPAPTVELVAAAIEERRPVTAKGVTVAAPVPYLVDFSLALSPDTAANRAAVIASLDEYLAREAEPGGTLPISRIRAAISSAEGEYSHNLTVPAADVAAPSGQIARRGTITWL